MTNGEPLPDIQSFIEANQGPLVAEQQAAVLARGNVVAAEVELIQAEAALTAAHERFRVAQDALEESNMDVGAAHNRIASAARNLAALIIKGPGDEATRTLLGLIYQDDRLARNDDSGTAYSEAAQEGQRALNDIIDRLKPGEPVLHISRYDVTAGSVPETGALWVELPAAVSGTEQYQPQRGSLDLVITKTVEASGEERPFVSVNSPEGFSIPLLNKDHKSDSVERLKEAAENTAWLIIGPENIARVLEQHEPWSQFVALTALREAGIEIPLELDPVLQAEIRAHLVALVTYKATGEAVTIQLEPDNEPPAETSLAKFFIGPAPEDEDSETDLNELASKKNELHELTKKITNQDIKAMARTLGLDKEAMRAEVTAALQAATEAGETFFAPQVNADGIERVLVTIFDYQAWE